MRAIENKVKRGLREKGISCQSVFRVPDMEDYRVLLSFNSKDSQRLTTMRVKKALNSLGIGEFKVPTDFQRLSASFLHLEVVFGARTERPITPTAH
ncbi:MAG: hypothetical protein RTU09_03015 [Candidatus Thorarchaeota archaeon]